MIIDIIFIIIVILAAFKGYSRGLIVGLFSFISVIIGLAAAMKFSTVVADYLGARVNVSKEWLPLIAFAVVFLVVVLLIRLGAKALEKTIEIALLGWVNRLGGMLLFLAIYITVLSVILFYAEQMKLLPTATMAHSVTWPFIQPWGPKAINAVGTIIPLFRDMFDDLQDFFASVADSK